MDTLVQVESSLAEVAEQFICSRIEQRPNIFAQLIAAFREALQARRFDETATVLRRVISPGLDYTSLQALGRVRRELKGKTSLALPRAKLAVLGSFTTKQLVNFIDLYTFSAGADLEIYEAEYGVFRQEIFDPTSKLYDFRPGILFLATTWRDLAHRPLANFSASEVQSAAEAEQNEWLELWQKAHSEFHCQIIQNNFAMPAWRTFGNYEMRHPASLGRYVARMNQLLADAAPSFTIIHDADHLAACAGRWTWEDPRFVHQAKMPCGPEFLPDYAHSVASLIAAQLGMAKKCIVLDLDNTIWGGVIGDDGLGGIRLGQGDPEGEAFLAFQQYLKDLGCRGVLLAVCSKNQERIARDAFDNHPEMVLRLSDVSCFVANWDDKPSNLRGIAKQLNIGLQSLVFIDDNPAERAVVRQLLPEIAVPELPEDVTGYIQSIERHRYFQLLSVGNEDFQRTEYYRADAMRREAQTSAADIDGFLASLKMVGRVSPITSVTLERSAQLIQRSNQFNLTTRRHSAAELSGFLADPSWVTCTVSLADRFGDNGLISVLLARVQDTFLEIDTWVMSCRVLKRGVEQLLLNHLCDLALERGLQTIRGQFIPTAKNDLVREHYSVLGFSKTSSGPDGQSKWELSLHNGRQPLRHFIKQETCYGSIAN